MQTPLNLSNRYKLQAALRQNVLFKFEFFEKATKDTIDALNISLEEHQSQLDQIRSRVPEINEHDYNNIDKEDWIIIDEFSELHTTVDVTKAYLLSLMEMKIVYLFKNLEVIMKRVIQITFPESNTKDFFQWENMKAFFKNKEIDLSHLEGYTECVQLRKVNNAIKHNGIVTEEIKKIKEFWNKDEFYFEDLNGFYNRVRQKIEFFSENLQKKVEQVLYDFPLERLNKIADGYYEKMDSRTLFTLIGILKDKMRQYPDYESFYEKDNTFSDDLPF